MTKPAESRIHKVVEITSGMTLLQVMKFEGQGLQIVILLTFGVHCCTLSGEERYGRT